jgi:hypothetical protein
VVRTKANSHPGRLGPDCHLDGLVAPLICGLKRRDAMFNHPLIHEEAKLQIKQREREAETYQRHQQLGYTDRRTGRWVFLFLMLIAALMISMVVL